MKKYLLILSIITICLQIDLDAQIYLGGITNIFLEESETIQDNRYFWIDYNLPTNLTDKGTGFTTIIPAVSLNFEKHLFSNLSLRAQLSTDWWEKEIVLARSPERDFTEQYNFQYWTLGAGATWHIQINERIDPYVGMLLTYRHIYAVCECSGEHRARVTTDFLIGARYFLNDRFFASLEIGKHGTGSYNAGIGFKF